MNQSRTVGSGSQQTNKQVPHMTAPALIRELRHLAVAAACVLAGCSDPLAPFEPEVSNATDSFGMQATGVTGITTTRTYTWSNTGTRATVNHSTTTSAGAVQLTIQDGTGTVVYDRALAPSLNEPTQSGTAGRWTVRIRMTDYSGTLNFRAQRL